MSVEIVFEPPAKHRCSTPRRALERGTVVRCGCGQYWMKPKQWDTPRGWRRISARKARKIVGG